MKELHLNSDKGLRHTSRSIFGNQPKEHIGDWYYKYDDYGITCGLTETLVSHALNFLFFDNTQVPHVMYESVANGCKCLEYKSSGEIEVTLDALVSKPSIEAIEKTSLAKDIAKYFVCDALFFNEDRHLGNLPILLCNNRIRLAPIFDFGNALSFYGEVDYTNFNPEPFGAGQVEWALKVLSGTNIVFKCTEFELNVGSIETAYADIQKEYTLKKIHKCAYSDFIQTRLRVI